MAAPNASGSNTTFEFEALKHAQNYRRSLIDEFRDYLRGDVIEIGAGVGQVTEEVARLHTVRAVTAVEPDARFHAEFRQRLPRTDLIMGTVHDLNPAVSADAILSVNVLEHIENDERELRTYAGRLRPRRGSLCLFVPARPEIYAPLDQDFGHFRRYTRPELRAKLERAGFCVLTLKYYNFIGYFAWALSFCVLRQRRFNPAAVRFFDRAIFPVGRFLEARVIRPPFGQSLLAIARSE
jgi:SAM-dependent methyltransferase